MRVLRLLLAVLVTSGALVVVTAGPATACSCVTGRTRDFVEAADEIVAGTLVEVQEPRALFFSSMDPVTYTLGVDAVYRGEVGEQVVFESARDGAACGLEGMTVDRRYVVFLAVEGDQRSASLCGGTALADPALESALERLTGPPAEPLPEELLPGNGIDDESAQSALPGWALGAGAMGLVGFVGALWLRLLRR